jgi:V/A-type H+-transporting ATPase subunit E
MDIKIQELTEKIYQEGIEKGNQEAAQIIAEANAKKEALIAEAEKEAKRIIENAEKKAQDTKKNADMEVKVAANQVIDSLKKEVTDLLTGEIINANVKPVVADKTFMQQVILEMARSWAKNEAFVIQSSIAEELKTYFEGNAKGLLDKGVKIEKVNGKSTSFTIQPIDGSYKVNFGEEEFILFFKELLRPILIEKLF